MTTLPENILHAALDFSSSEKRRVPSDLRWVFNLLKQIQGGTLILTTPTGENWLFGPRTHAASCQHLVIEHWDAIRCAIKSGDIGFAESFIRGEWHTPDLSGLLKLIVRNRTALTRLVYGNKWMRVINWIRHLSRRNSRAGSRKNIHAHYDIGNDFYRLWLDRSMSYSSALFDKQYPDESLFAAQQRKYQRALDELQCEGEASLLEIGCGWGGLAEVAATRGMKLECLTLSTEQKAYTEGRMARAKLDQQVNVYLRDYRDMHAPEYANAFDGIVSIEMLEAVGEAYWSEYFSILAHTLKPGARACIQTIVIAEDLFDDYRRGSDFIQQYIFPGGMLPTCTRLRQLANDAGLEFSNELKFGPDYARTLKLWRDRFNFSRQEIMKQGFDEKFMRTWEFYLAYCEAGFDQANTDVVQITVRKPT